jgi:hypothetical protein
MATTLTLDRGLDFERALPGERTPSALLDREPAPTVPPAPATAPVAAAIAAPALPSQGPRGSRRSWTLDDLIVGAWEDLLATRSVACPLCGGAMASRHGAGPAPAAGRCGSCGTTLA